MSFGPLIINKLPVLCPSCCNIYLGENFMDAYFIWDIPAHECMFCGYLFTSDSYFKELILNIRGDLIHW